MKTAAFYDLENLGFPIKNGEFEQTFTRLLERVRSNALIGDIALQRAYISKSNGAIDHIKTVLQKFGIELVAVEPFSGSPAKKKTNLVDFKMMVDVVAIAAAKRSVTTIAIASGDNDFGFLGQKIKEMGRRLVVISKPDITGEAMLRLCDDWVSLTGQALPFKYTPKLIAARIVTDYNAELNFFPALCDFLSKLENDHLICRCMAETGLLASVFVDILRRRGIVFPNYEKLGFGKITSFLAVILRNTNFQFKGGSVFYNPGKQSLAPHRLAESLLGVPPGYSREKLMRCYDIVNDLDDVDEFVAYIGFMKRSGMLSDKGLCPKRTFRAIIRGHIQKVLADAGIALEKNALLELVKKL
jgi:uncharacterized LabA/DUF88 family protein